LKPNEVRIAFAGDSVTVGNCGSDIETLKSLPVESRLNDVYDGS